MQGIPLVYFFILLKAAKLMFGLGTTWECSEGDGVRNFEYIGPADAFDFARLSWLMCSVGK